MDTAHSDPSEISERRLWTFEPAPLDGGDLYIDQRQPIGLFVKDGARSFVEWREAIIPSVAFSSLAFPTAHGVWIVYTPYAWISGPTPGVQNTAAFLGSSGLKLSVSLGRREVVGVDEQGLWSVGPQQTMSSEDFTGGSLPKDWVRPVELIRHNINGTTTAITLDRPVSEVEAAGNAIRIVFHPTPPIAAPASFGGVHYQYPLCSIEVPEPVEPTTAVHVEEFAWTRVTDDKYGSPSYMADVRSRQERESALPRPAIPDDLIADWPTVDPSAIDIEAVIERGLKEFSNVKGISKTLSNPETTLVGAWPTVDIVITFNWSRHPGARFRHVVHLFDQGGRPALTEYASVNFMEDLDTLPFTAPTEPVGEYIDF